MEPKAPIETVKCPNMPDTREKKFPYHNDIIIFIVDDDPMYLKALEFQFKQNPNLKIETFLSGEASIEKLCLKPDIVILDYVLESEDKKAMDGLQTLVKIKETLPDTQVIMLSARESVDVATNSIRLGAFDYVVKNQDTFKRLKACIKKILGVFAKEKEIIIWDW